jgi:hypothetical protein
MSTKLLKSAFCIAAVLALGASLGAGTASATELCKTASTPCPAADMYASGTVFRAELVGKTQSWIDTNLDDVFCSGSKLEGKTTSTGGSGATAVSAEITTLTFTGCEDQLAKPCTGTTVNLPYSASFTGSGSLAALTVTDAAGAGVKFVCSPVVNCTFSTKSMTVEVTGALTPPRIVIAGQPMERSGSFCPSEAFWVAEYEVTSPTPLMVI